MRFHVSYTLKRRTAGTDIDRDSRLSDENLWKSRSACLAPSALLSDEPGMTGGLWRINRNVSRHAFVIRRNSVNSAKGRSGACYTNQETSMLSFLKIVGLMVLAATN